MARTEIDGICHWHMQRLYMILSIYLSDGSSLLQKFQGIFKCCLTLLNCLHIFEPLPGCLTDPPHHGLDLLARTQLIQLTAALPHCGISDFCCLWLLSGCQQCSERVLPSHRLHQLAAQQVPDCIWVSGEWGGRHIGYHGHTRSSDAHRLQHLQVWSGRRFSLWLLWRSACVSTGVWRLQMSTGVLS